MPPATIDDPGESSSLVTVLDLLRQGRPMTRPQLIATTGLGRRVVDQRVEDLMSSGLVAEGPREASTGGRPASTVEFRHDRGIVLTAEVSPSILRAGYCDLSGRLVAWQEESITVDLGPEAILDRVQVLWDAVLQTVALADKPLMAAGIGVIGPVDTEHVARSPVVTPYGWDGGHVRDRLQARYDVPVWADNAVNMMALAEFKLRADRDRSDLALVLIDEGIGAGLISNGRLHRGADGVAGELGHVTVSDDPSLACWCGKTGCLTQIASIGSIERDLGRHVFADSMTEPARDEVDDEVDAVAQTRYRVAGEATGRALADLVNVFNPAEIVVGGRVAALGAPFLDPLVRVLRERTFPASGARLRVTVTPREDQLGLTGAGIMALDGVLGPAFASRWLRT